MDDQRDNEAKRTVADKVDATDRRTASMAVALFGPEGQPSMGAIPRIEEHLKNQAARISEIEKLNVGGRLAAMEGNILKATIGVIASLFGMVWQLVSGIKH